MPIPNTLLSWPRLRARMAFIAAFLALVLILAAPTRGESHRQAGDDTRSPASGPTFEDQVVELVNQERWNNGHLPPLKRNASLATAAESHSNNMAQRDFFAHCDPDTGKWPWDRMTDAGYNWDYAAENIAAGYNTPAAAMAGWMGSSGHRANILSSNVREIGVGYAYQSGDQKTVRYDNDSNCSADSFSGGPFYNYWTQKFGRRNNVYPVIINREAYESGDRNVDLYIYAPSGAQEMRFRNENSAWSAWQPYSPNAAWTLSPGNGSKTVEAEVRTATTVYQSHDSILLNASDPGPSPTPIPLSNPVFMPLLQR